MNNICGDGFNSNLYAGDNFRSVSRQPPADEQDSFSLLNLVDLVGSPYGQFLNGLWRGKESRANLQAHLKGTYKELDSAVRQGVKLKLKYIMSAFFELLILHLKLTPPPPPKKKNCPTIRFYLLATLRRTLPEHKSPLHVHTRATQLSVSARTHLKKVVQLTCTPVNHFFVTCKICQTTLC